MISYPHVFELDGTIYIAYLGSGGPLWLWHGTTGGQIMLTLNWRKHGLIYSPAQFLLWQMG